MFEEWEKEYPGIPLRDSECEIKLMEKRFILLASPQHYQSICFNDKYYTSSTSQAEVWKSASGILF